MLRSCLIVGLLLAGAVVLELWPRVALSPAAREPGVAPRPEAQVHGQPPAPAVSLDGLLARPLFDPDRRPKRETAVATPGPGAAPLPRMSGILVDGDERRAIFAAAGDGRPVVVAEGGRIGAFTVRRIEPREVTVSGPDGTVVLRTSFDTRPAPTATAVPPGLAGLLPPDAFARQ